MILLVILAVVVGAGLLVATIGMMTVILMPSAVQDQDDNDDDPSPSS